VENSSELNHRIHWLKSALFEFIQQNIQSVANTDIVLPMMARLMKPVRRQTYRDRWPCMMAGPACWMMGTDELKLCMIGKNILYLANLITCSILQIVASLIYIYL